MKFENGYIPDEVQAQEARKVGEISDRDKILKIAVPFDDVNAVPPVIEWSSFYEFISKMADVENGKWWEVSGSKDLFTDSQGMRPNCAGFALANASQVRVLMQVLNEFTEQVPEAYNPQGTWQKSKNGSTRGGQTISAIADAGRETGNCLKSDLGEYSDSQSFRTLNQKTLENASRHQIGISLFDGPREEVPDAIFTLCKKGFTAIVGNCTAIQDGRQKDENGVECVSVSRQEWAHATAFGGWQKVNGKEYVFWLNSHGPIYSATDGSPAFGGWMDMNTLKQFVQGQFFDLCAVVYAETEADENAKITLNPWRHDAR